MTIAYVRGAELPNLQLWWRDQTGALIDFSTGWTFTVKIGRVGSTAKKNKTSGITGAAGSGTSSNGTPNLVVAWATGELDIPAGQGTIQITANNGTQDRIWQAPFQIFDNVY